MIGWKAKIGYTTIDLASGSDLKSLDQIEFYDNAGIVSLLQAPYSPYNLTNLTYEGLLSTAQKYFMDDLNYFYCVPTGSYLETERQKELVNGFIVDYPAANKGSPKTWESATAISTDIWDITSCIYFESLSRLLTLRESYTHLYIVGSDGSLTYVSGFSAFAYGNCAYFGNPKNPGVRVSSFVFKSGIDANTNNIVNPNNYSGVSIYRTANGRCRFITTELNSGTKDSLGNILKNLFHSDYPPDWDVPTNPYEPGGPSGPTDPDLPPGTFDDESDTIPDSPLPTISAADTGFTRIYNPTLSQVQALAQYLWTTPDIIETIWNHIKQFFENPMDAIIGFNLVPVPVPDGGTTNFKLMYIDTGVAMTAAANQFVDVDCGTLEVKRYYGSALDQSPYTKVSCFLPYIGTVQLNTDEVMGATLQVKYRVDICSGSCVAKIFIDGNCIYQYSGHCAINIPISSADFSSYVSAAINVAKLAIGAATAGAGGAAMAAAQTAGNEQQTGNTMTFQPQSSSSPYLPAIYQGQSQQQPPAQTTTSASFAGLSPANISNTVGEIMNAKPHVEHSGSFSGNTGYLGVRRPFIIIERPNMCMPENYQALNGFPAMITMELSTCKGFTRIQQVQLTGMTATNPEQAEILELLKSGVIL